MDPLGERVEIEVSSRAIDLPVHYATLGQRSRTTSTSSGKYLVGGLPVRLPSSTSGAVAEHDRPEPVPLRLVVPQRDLRHGLGEHRLDGRHHGQIPWSDCMSGPDSSPVRVDG